MVDTTKKLDNLSDEDFMKLDPSDFSGDMAEGETSFVEHQEGVINAENASEEEESPDTDQSPADDSESESAYLDDAADTDSETPKEPSTESDDTSLSDEEFSAQEAPSDEQPTEDTEEKGSETDAEAGGSERPESVDDKSADTPAQAGYFKLPDGVNHDQATAALSFYEVISKPFKADGKEFTVRNPDEAIRLMQQGLNYSRRMQELKPSRHLTRMLEDHSLNDPEKLSFLIDLQAGNKDAILKLLKDHNIDIMDLDPDKETGYQTPNYGGSATLNEFRDALEVAMTSRPGQELVSHIHETWDDVSKTHLRENPGILGNLTEMKSSGIYDRVVEELNHQRSLGYLTGVPFLQAFDQVGEAMKNAGVFNQQAAPQNPASMAPVQGQPQRQPIARGSRKDPAPKKADPNPLVSSTPPAKQTNSSGAPEPDFAKMSDEDFLKMEPPS